MKIQSFGFALAAVVFVTTSLFDVAMMHTQEVLIKPAAHPPPTVECATWCPREKIYPECRTTYCSALDAMRACDPKHKPLTYGWPSPKRANADSRDTNRFWCKRTTPATDKSQHTETEYESDLRQTIECAPFYYPGLTALRKWPEQTRRIVSLLHRIFYSNKYMIFFVWLLRIKWLVVELAISAVQHAIFLVFYVLNLFSY